MALQFGLLGPPAPQAPQAPRAPQLPSNGFTSFDDYVKAFHQARDGGSLFGGGQQGINERGYEMSGRGRAPFTAAGIGTALSNAAGLLRGVTSPFGLAGLMMTATNSRPGGGRQAATRTGPADAQGARGASQERRRGCRVRSSGLPGRNADDLRARVAAALSERRDRLRARGPFARKAGRVAPQRPARRSLRRYEQ